MRAHMRDAHPASDLALDAFDEAVAEWCREAGQPLIAMSLGDWLTDLADRDDHLGYLAAGWREPCCLAIRGRRALRAHLADAHGEEPNDGLLYFDSAVAEWQRGRIAPDGAPLDKLLG